MIVKLWGQDYPTFGQIKIFGSIIQKYCEIHSDANNRIQEFKSLVENDRLYVIG